MHFAYLFCISLLVGLAPANVIRRKRQNCPSFVVPSGCIGCTCTLTPSINRDGCPSYMITCKPSVETKLFLEGSDTPIDPKDSTAVVVKGDTKPKPKPVSKPDEKEDSKPVEKEDSKPVEKEDSKPVEKEDSKPVETEYSKDKVPEKQEKDDYSKKEEVASPKSDEKSPKSEEAGSGSASPTDDDLKAKLLDLLSNFENDVSDLEGIIRGM